MRKKVGYEGLSGKSSEVERFSNLESNEIQIDYTDMLKMFKSLD